MRSLWRSPIQRLRKRCMSINGPDVLPKDYVEGNKPALAHRFARVQGVWWACRSPAVFHLPQIHLIADSGTKLKVEPRFGSALGCGTQCRRQRWPLMIVGQSRSMMACRMLPMCAAGSRFTAASITTRYADIIRLGACSVPAAVSLESPHKGFALKPVKVTRQRTALRMPPPPAMYNDRLIVLFCRCPGCCFFHSLLIFSAPPPHRPHFDTGK